MLIALTILDRGAQYLADVVKTAIRVNHGSSSPMAITDRSTAYPKMLMRSAIALASVRPQEATNDRIHPPPHGEPRCSKQTNESPIFVLVKKRIHWVARSRIALAVVAIRNRSRMCPSVGDQRSPSAIALSDGDQRWSRVLAELPPSPLADSPPSPLADSPPSSFADAFWRANGCVSAATLARFRLQRCRRLRSQVHCHCQ